MKLDHSEAVLHHLQGLKPGDAIQISKHETHYEVIDSKEVKEVLKDASDGRVKKENQVKAKKLSK